MFLLTKLSKYVADIEARDSLPLFEDHDFRQEFKSHVCRKFQQIFEGMVNRDAITYYVNNSNTYDNVKELFLYYWQKEYPAIAFESTGAYNWYCDYNDLYDLDQVVFDEFLKEVGIKTKVVELKAKEVKPYAMYGEVEVQQRIVFI